MANINYRWKGAVEPAETSPSGNTTKLWKGSVEPFEFGGGTSTPTPSPDDSRLTLHYNFAVDKSLVPRAGPTLSLTRASEGTYIDAFGVMQTAASGVARYGHDPVTLESLGLLVEASRTNLALYSGDTSNAAWVSSNITKGSDSVTDPMGNANTTVRLTASAGNGTLLQSITSAADKYIYAVYMKRVIGTGDVDLTLDNGATWTTQTLTADWTRFVITDPAQTNPIFGVRIVTSGDAIDFWGSDVNKGEEVITSHIPTTSAPVQRNDDKLQTLIVDWFNNGGDGTFYSHSVKQGSDTADDAYIIQCRDWSESASRYYHHANGLAGGGGTSGRVGTMALDGRGGMNTLSNAHLNGVATRVASSVTVDNLQSYWNGVPDASPDTTVTPPDGVDRFFVGSASANSRFWNGHIAEIRYYNVRLTDEQLEAMSNGEFPSEGNDFYIAVTRRTLNSPPKKFIPEKPIRGSLFK